MPGAAAGVADCEARIARLYGRAAVGELRAARARVLHPTAVSLQGDAQVTIRVGPNAPASDDDAFALALARARSDWIVTSGANLRHEPDLRHDWSDVREGSGLTAWRQTVLERASPPRVAVLSRGRELDLGHPVFAGDASPAVLVTTEEAAERLRSAADRAGVELMPRREPGLRDLLDVLSADAPGATCCIEVGPSTSLDLYQAPIRVDELLLSGFRGRIGEGVTGGSFLGAEALRQRLGAPRSDVAFGDWQFQRFVR